MTHAGVRERLSRYLDGDLGARERERVGAHLERCPECAAELRSLRAAVGLLRSLPDVEPPPGLARRALARIEATPPPGRLARWLASLGVAGRGARAALLVGSAAAVALLLLRVGGSGPGAPPQPPSAADLAERLQAEAGALGIQGPLGAAPAPEPELPGPEALSPDAAVDRALAAPLAFVEDWQSRAAAEREAWLARVAARAAERGAAERIARGLRASGDPRALALAERFAPLPPGP